jgi:hypothetical protein
MDSSVPERPAETLTALGKPTMLVIGDADIVRPEHAVETFRLFGGRWRGMSPACRVLGWPSCPAPPTSRWCTAGSG